MRMSETLEEFIIDADPWKVAMMVEDIGAQAIEVDISGEVVSLKGTLDVGMSSAGF